MQKYYGLRLTRAFFMTSAIVICIFTIAGIGAIAIPQLIAGKSYDWIQGLTILIIGGIVAVSLYTVSQIADAQIRNYQTSYRVLRHVAKSNELNSQILEMLTVQLEIMRHQYNIADDVKINRIIAQIEARRTRLDSIQPE